MVMMQITFILFFIFILGDNKVILNIESQLNNDGLDAALR